MPPQYRCHYDEAVIGCWEDGCGGAVATLAAGEVGVAATADGLVGTVLLLLLLALLLLLQLLLLAVLALLLGVPSEFTATGAAAAAPAPDATGEVGALDTVEAPCSVAVFEEDDELVSSKFATAEDASTFTARLLLSVPSFAGATEDGVDGVANSSAVT